MRNTMWVGGALLVALTWAAPLFATDANAANTANTVSAASGQMTAARRRVYRARPVAPKVAPQPKPRQWTYMSQRMSPPRNDKWKARWNDIGMQGWELVAVQENFFIFKRPSDYPYASAPTTPEPTKVAPAPTKVKTKKK